MAGDWAAKAFRSKIVRWPDVSSWGQRSDTFHRIRSSLIEHHTRATYALDTSELGRRPGTMREVQITVPAPSDLGSDVIGVSAGSPLDLDIRLEAVMEGVLVTGEVRGRAVGECVRCLDPVDLEFTTRFQELFLYPEAQASAAEAGDDEEMFVLDGDIVDVERIVRDSVVPALPFQPICRDDCAGLCAECGVRLDDHPGHRHDSVDPRWAALRSVFDETKES